jgi:beta-glucosidase
MLHNMYLPPFKAAVEEGAATVMAAFHDLNGVPCTVNAYTLREILKSDYGFDGFVVSDANAIRECVTHGIAEDDKQAGIQAALAGLDMDMGTEIYKNRLREAIEEGSVTIEVIDEAVRRILSVKIWLGLFEHPYVDENTIGRYETLPKEHTDLAREAAEKSIVLLKNEDHLLPLKKTQKISLVGQLAKMREEVVGAWSISWKEKDCVSIYDGLKNSGANMQYFACGGPETELNEEEIQKAGEYGDVIVAVVGELISMSGEASSRADITLPGCQREMLKKLAATGKPVVAVLMNGRPLALDWEAGNLPAIVEGWHLGIQMGNAIAEVLFGEKNPEGKLTSTFPVMTGQCPIYYNHPNTGRPGSRSKFTSRYLDAGYEPLYVFGYGLSYTDFSYSDLGITDSGDALEIRVSVQNTGACKGRETVQLYMQDVTASLVCPVRELKDFAKVELDANETKQVEFCLKKQDMGFYDNQGKYVCEDGLFRIYVGGNSRDCLMQECEVKFI